MNALPVLVPGDSVELIAPASRCTDVQLDELKQLMKSWQLKCIVKDDIFGEDFLCANTDEKRFLHLKEALLNPQTKAVICVRGGYGSLRLIPELTKLNPVRNPKIFVGMSDITSLHLFLQQQWGWPVILGAAAPSKFSAESIASLKSLMFAEKESVEFLDLKPLNEHAKQSRLINSSVTGGNLAIIQAGIGTNWQMDCRNKIVLLEEVNERGYRVDRMLEQLFQANILKGAAAIVLADFLGGDEPDGSSLMQPVLQRFAESCEVPVVQMQGVGHGEVNYAVPFNTGACLQLGETVRLSCYR